METMSTLSDEELDSEKSLESIGWCVGLRVGAQIGGIVVVEEENDDEEIPSVWRGLQNMWKKEEKLKDADGGECEKDSR